MDKHEKVKTLIQEIRDSSPLMEEIFLRGSCCNFHYVLKSVVPDAEPWFNSEHVITRIDNSFYDITGEVKDVFNYEPLKSYYFNKYKDDCSIKEGEMYDPKLK